MESPAGLRILWSTPDGSGEWPACLRHHDVDSLGRAQRDGRSPGAHDSHDVGSSSLRLDHVWCDDVRAFLAGFDMAGANRRRTYNGLKSGRHEAFGSIKVVANRYKRCRPTCP